MRRLLIASVIVALWAAGCGRAQPPQPPALPAASAGTAAPAGTAPAASTPGGPAPGGSAPAAAASTRAGDAYRVTYGWGVPSTPRTVTNRVAVPIAPPPAIPLPYLVEIRTGDHGNEQPGYVRITFTFAGAYPSYQISYVPQLLGEGSGAPVPLAGNSVLRIQFTPAQAHDNAGASTVQFAADRQVNLRNLRGYAPAGDFEGYLTYGLGIQVAAGSDQVLPVRVGQLSRPDAQGQLRYVVAVDVRVG
ncbi:MAG TPA: hypothetical protein VFM55_19995 [Micromonosporaceae bacterium]|nr:hypothetical protein [Micromonosporaceae bacterium]